MKTSDGWQNKVEIKLAELAFEGRMMTYLEMAEHADIPSPYRIHQLAEFLEELIRLDAPLGRPIRAAFIVSKKDKLPADGFFNCLSENGMTAMPDETRAAFHHRLIHT